MVLSEALGLWLSSIVREGIGFALETRVFKHGPDFTGCYSPSNRASPLIAAPLKISLRS